MSRSRKEKIHNRNRLRITFGIIILLICILALRLAWIQIVKQEDYTQKAMSQQMSDMPIEAKRGNIFDRNGKELASSTICYSVIARTSQLRNNYKTEAKLEEISSKLSVILGQKSESIKKKLKSDDYFITLARYLTKDQKDKVNGLKIIGIEVVEGTKRYYPLGNAASQLLGSVTDSNVGRTGIEAQFDNVLSGVSGRWIKETDNNGETLSYGSQRLYKAKDGYNVYLTIDEVLQHYAENAVASAMRKTKAKRIMFLAMNPKNGDVLAMVTNPGFDPNNATEPSGEEAKLAYKKMSSKKQSEYLSGLWRNPIVSDLYEPGSTFKLVTTSAALEEGVTTPNTHYYDKGFLRVGDTVLHCWNTAGHGRQTLTEAVGNSCNPVQMQLAAKLGIRKYYNYLEMFGITDITNISLPDETSAIIKDQASLTNVDLATMSYGHGIALTPIQILTAACSIGNKGVLMQPRIVKKFTDKDGKTEKIFKNKEIRKVISEKTANEMKDIMEFVVEKGGGGGAKVPGYRVGGKTGTADKVVNGRYTKDTYSSFLGMAPMENPKLAILVVIDSPKGVQFGSAVAAPVGKEFLKKALNYLEISPGAKGSVDENKIISYVPNIKKLTYAQAVNVLVKSGFKYQLIPKNSKGVTNLKVIDQYPKPGTKSTKGSTVYIYWK